jgi:hypothetical protein
MSIVDYFGRISREAVDSYHKRPVYRSWWFGIPLALCVIDTFYEIWILTGYWGHLTSDTRFWLIYLAAVTIFALVMTYRQHHAVREADIGDDLARRLAVTTVFIVSWSYVLLSIALHLILQFVKHGCP